MSRSAKQKPDHQINAGIDQQMLDRLFKVSFQYFKKRVNAKTGLVADSSKKDSPASVGVVGMALSTYIVALENSLISLDETIHHVLKILRFFYYSKQGPNSDTSGYKGFYYHFLDMKTGLRVTGCELTTIDTTYFIAGALSAASYFSANSKDETEIRQLADALYRRIDWQWSLAGTCTISHRWKPESGFLPLNWNDNYIEAMILYMLAMGSPTYPIGDKGYKKWVRTFEIKKKYGIEFIYAGPLFIHQFSHVWIDFRNISDDFTKKSGFKYFENSRRATHMHREYAIRNPHHFKEYNKFFWGQSASDGPGEKTLIIKGRKREFFGYKPRGAPFGPDDGTVSPWAVVASLLFAPDDVLKTIRYCIENFGRKQFRLLGFETSFNPTYPNKHDNLQRWVSPNRYGLNQGAIILMIENYRTGHIWNIMSSCGYLQEGLKIAGFSKNL